MDLSVTFRVGKVTQRAGNVRLAVIGDERPGYKNVPTMKELGMATSTASHRLRRGPPKMPRSGQLAAAFRCGDRSGMPDSSGTVCCRSYHPNDPS
jgi:hypothetical protein